MTTHMMIEADALSTRIAIVAKGALKVVGTQQHLKDNYGSGYLLQVRKFFILTYISLHRILLIKVPSFLTSFVPVQFIYVAKLGQR
jgi:ABC-type multidrug transport system ATPase subunit